MFDLIQEITSTIGPHGERYEMDVELKHNSVYVKICHPTLGIISTIRQEGRLAYAIETALEKARQKWREFQAHTAAPKTLSPSYYRGDS